MSKQFVSVNFTTGQLLDEDTMNQINNNTVYLRDQSVDGKWTNEWGAVIDTNIKTMCGRIWVPAQNVPVVYGTIAFTSLFSPGCEPIVTTSIVAQGARYEHTIRGIGVPVPDHRGFQFKLKIGEAYNNKVFTENVCLHWIAMGY